MVFIGFVIKTDVLVPQHEYVREYTGMNPAKLFSFIPKEMQFLFQLESSMFFEDKVYWDKSSEPTTFYGEWRGTPKNLITDGFSSGWVRVKLQGSQSAQTKMGSVTLWIYGYVQTDFKYDNPFFDALRYLYVKTLYQKQIHQHINLMKTLMDKFDMAVRGYFELEKVGKEK